MPTHTLPLTSYRSAARSLGAKSAGAAALGLVAVTAAAPQASAQIVAVTFTGTTAGQYDYYGSVSNFASMDTGVVSTADFSGTDFRIVTSTDNNDGFWSAVWGANGAGIAAATVGQGPATNFAKDAVIGSGTTFTTTFAELNRYGTGVAPAWSNTTGYFGIRFNPGDGFHYGWVKLQTNGNASQWAILGGAYNSVVGESILAGQGPTTPVPEPATSAALLALGAAGLVAYRQRKKLQRAAA